MPHIVPNSFAEACFDQNGIPDLEAALRGEADPIDMRQWGLGAAEWREQVELALEAKRLDA